MKSRRYIMAVLASSAVALVSIPPATAGEQRTLSVDEQEEVYDTMLAMGVSTTDAALYSDDSQVWPYVATSITTDVQTGGAAGLVVEEPDTGELIPAPAYAPAASGSKTPAYATEAIGSECSGRSGWVQRNQYYNNVWGHRLLTTTLKTTFCYNGSRVTYANSSQTWSRTALGSGAGWRVSSWNFSEGWYAYNGRTNGGVKSVSQANLDACILKIGCHTDGTAVMRTYAHYNGTWSTSGYIQ